MTATRICHYCGPTDEELRPYGPGGSPICFPCMKADPQREKAAAGVYGALLDATTAIGLTAIGTEAGPINVDPQQLGELADEDDGMCSCESYDCAGECCGIEKCSCTPTDDVDASEEPARYTRRNP